MSLLGRMFGDDPELSWQDLRGDYDASVAAAGRGVEAAQASLDYWQNQNVVWTAMFGDLQANLAKYYEELTPTGVAAEYAENITTRIAQSKERDLQTLQDRGLTQSGMTSQMLSQYGSTQAIALANSAYQANKDIKAQQLGFFQNVANPQLQNIQTGQQASYGALQRGYAAEAQAYGTRGRAQMEVERFNELGEGAVARDVLGAATQIGGTALGYYMGGPTGAKFGSDVGANITPKSNRPALESQPFQYPDYYNA